MTKKEQAREIGRSNALTAVDQQGDHPSLQAALDAYWDNMLDTLNEQGLSRGKKLAMRHFETARYAFLDALTEVGINESPRLA